MMKKNLLTLFVSAAIIFVASGFFPSNELSVVGCRQLAVGGLQSIPVTDTTLRIIHIYVSLADNDSQGIIPVSRKLGNGNDAANNLYWGAQYGIKTFFSQCDDWQMIDSTKNINSDILQRCVFKHRRNNTYIVADAYRGAHIKTCTMNFLLNVSGHPCDSARIQKNGKSYILLLENSDLVCYVGHDGFMDFEIPNPPPQNSAGRKDVMIFAAVSRLYFKDPILTAGGIPILWTSNLLSVDAYSVKAAIDGWMFHESGPEICYRAAKAYDSFQKCGLIEAQNIFVSGYY